MATSDLIEEILTLQEVAETLCCSDSALRKHVLSEKYKEAEFRKAKGVILFNKSVILIIKEEK